MCVGSFLQRRVGVKVLKWIKIIITILMLTEWIVLGTADCIVTLTVFKCL